MCNGFARLMATHALIGQGLKQQCTSGQGRRQASGALQAHCQQASRQLRAAKQQPGGSQAARQQTSARRTSIVLDSWRCISTWIRSAACSRPASSAGSPEGRAGDDGAGALPLGVAPPPEERPTATGATAGAAGLAAAPPHRFAWEAPLLERPGPPSLPAPESARVAVPSLASSAAAAAAPAGAGMPGGAGSAPSAQHDSSLLSASSNS